VASSVAAEIMASVVITGSTKGIGRGLATEFLRRGHSVVVSSRQQADVDQAVSELGTVATGQPPGRIVGRTCDVTRKADCQALWDFAAASFGRVDFWINNAGRAVSRFAVHETDEPTVHSLVDGNLKGTIFGSQTAINGFRRQGGGALYNMLGGSFGTGRLTPNMGVYSATKAADFKLSQYLVEENRSAGILVGTISPGMLISDNWFAEQRQMDPAEWPKIRPLLNVLCDHVDTATPWIVEQLLANRKPGHRIAWLTNGKILRRFVARYVFGRKRDLFARYGL
jgi:NAD(P)-dependent dehydrogenase (short-subunit alcohol dehydrogenase family)